MPGDATQPKSRRRGTVNNASVKALTATQRQAQAVELRKSGHTFQDIADKLGYKNPSGAHAAVMSALRKTLQEPSDELRTLELERLDAMLNSLWPQIVARNAYTPRAVEVALKVMDRRAALLGLDAPKQVEDHRTVTLMVMAEHWADRTGLDKNEIIAEAQRIVAEAAAETV